MSEIVITENLDLFGIGWWDKQSADGVYRYEVGHRFARGELVGFVGINPSTMVADKPDATGRKWSGFAKRWGFGGWIAVNPFAFKATYPRELMTAADPIGPRNDEVIREAMGRVSEVIACWGNPPTVKLVPRLKRVAEMLAELGKPLRCVGFTQLCQPKHLLRESYASPREAFEP